MASAAAPEPEMVVRVTRTAGGRATNHTPAPTTAEATNAAATGVTTRRHLGVRGVSAADAVPAGATRLSAFTNRGRFGQVGAVGGGFLVRDLREAEVQDFHRPVRRQLDVAGLQIAMDDAALVSGF